MRDRFRLGFRTEMKAGSEDGEIMLWGEIASDDWKWSKDDKSSLDFDRAVKDMKKAGVKNLHLRINSPGGEVYEAVAMRSIINSAGFDRIHVLIQGMCASAATLLATLPKADTEIAPGSTFMIHNPWTLTWGSAEDLEKQAADLRAMEADMRAMYAKKSGQSDEQIKAWMDAETWMTADEAVERGFCDRISDEGQSKAMPAAASVTREQMRIMKGMYHAIPDTVTERAYGGLVNPAQISIGKEPEELLMPPEKLAMTAQNLAAAAAAVLNGSNENPVAGFSTVINSNKEDTDTMELENLTVEQLREGNPALLDSIRQDAAREALEQDQERRNEIEDLTTDENRDLAEEAKNTGMSAVDFMRACAKRQREAKQAEKDKGAAYIQNRAKETEPARDVAGEAPKDDRETGEDLKAFAEEMKAFAETAKTGSGMY